MLLNVLLQELEETIPFLTVDVAEVNVENSFKKQVYFNEWKLTGNENKNSRVVINEYLLLNPV